MNRAWICLSLLLVQFQVLGQFPFTRELEVRSGQHRPSIMSMVQDSAGLLWLGTDLGILRTDGERVEVVFNADGDQVTAIAHDGAAVTAALAQGIVLRCDAVRCDTILRSEELVASPVRSIVTGAEGAIWLGSYGGGIWILRNDGVHRLGTGNGLRDEHVNGLAALPDGKVVAATDQGLALCGAEGVVQLLGEAEGAPDNLVMCVATTDSGIIWAGTDRSGPFSWDPVSGEIATHEQDWNGELISTIEVIDREVWIGTGSGEVVVHDASNNGGSYRYGGVGGDTQPVQDMMIDRSGAIWWADGTEILHRADPSLLFVPSHENVDLRNSSAICADRQGRIWFATPGGLFNHRTAFTEGQTIGKVPVLIDERKPIVSLAAESDGTIWAATFGGGIIRVEPEGGITYFNSGNSDLNDNVLSVKVRDDEVWFATLEGLAEYSRSSGMISHPLPFPGFLFDVLPLTDGSILAATDGAGIMRLSADRQQWSTVGRNEGTYYSLAEDAAGNAWAAGPGTGIMRVRSRNGLVTMDTLAPFDGDLFAMVYHEGHILAFGSTGTVAYDLAGERVKNITARLGSQEMQVGLNSVTTDHEGSIWLTSDLGLVRIRPRQWHLDDGIRAVITSVQVGGVPVDHSNPLELPHDHDRIGIQFSGIHWVDPAAIRFEYRLLGLDRTGRSTRDREIAYSGLPPGEYTFQLRAFTGSSPGAQEWTSFTFRIVPPLWQRPWAVAAMVITALGLLALFVKLRDRRVLERQRMEQEKVRFQLEALRSQVDPHFLFNSFNTLVELIESDAGRAVDHVERLSQFFRNILQVRDKELITLEEELKLLKNYFSLEKHRFGDAIALKIMVPGDDRGMAIVPLTLQLLVENALKHNVATPEKPLVITIRSFDGMIEVSNEVRERLTPPRSTGFGLESIRKRYGALSTRPISAERKNGLFVVHIPLIASHESVAHRG